MQLRPLTSWFPALPRVPWKQEGAKKRENWRNSKEFRTICPRQNRCDLSITANTVTPRSLASTSALAMGAEVNEKACTRTSERARPIVLTIRSVQRARRV